MAFSLDDYVDVGERIHSFYERFPEGSLQSYRDPSVIEVGGRAFVVYAAAAYRTPDDPVPGIGWAWEPVPGGTPYTKDSELMNAETSAWGRAIVSLGFDTKKVASRQEVRNRQPAPEKQQGMDLSRLGAFLKEKGLLMSDLYPVLELPEDTPRDASATKAIQTACDGWMLANSKPGDDHELALATATLKRLAELNKIALEAKDD